MHRVVGNGTHLQSHRIGGQAEDSQGSLVTLLKGRNETVDQEEGDDVGENRQEILKKFLGYD